MEKCLIDKFLIAKENKKDYMLEQKRSFVKKNIRVTKKIISNNKTFQESSINNNL